MIQKPEYSISDFKNIMYPVFDVPEEKSILRSLPKHFKHPEWKADLKPLKFLTFKEKNQVIRYIVCVYDQNSPFNADEEYSDLIQRKFAAVLYAGFKLDEDDKFEHHVEQMIFNNLPPINKMIVRYCRQHLDPEYAFIKAIEDDYYRKLEAVHSSKTYDYNVVLKMRNELKKATIAFLSEDNDKDLIKDLYRFVNEDNLKLRPEDIADSLANGVQPISYQEVSSD